MRPLQFVVAAIILALCFRVAYIHLWRRSKADYVPWAFPYLRWIPRWLAGTTYAHFASALLTSGARKHGEKAFRLVRHDTDLIVLPASVLPELSGLPADVASNIHALGYDLCGRWTGLSMLQSSTLHTRVTHRRITPSMEMLAPELEDEVSSALSDLFPQNTEWHLVTPYFVMLQVAARVFSRVVVGRKYCRNEVWLGFARNFTENTFNSVLTMRYFPTWMYPFLSYTIPSVRASIANLREVESLLVPIFEEQINERRANADKSSASSSELNGVAWLTGIAHEEDLHPLKMAHALVLLALGSIHTSLFSELNALYDLIAMPNLMDELREEIGDVLERGRNARSYDQLHKMDSVLRESQRRNPPFVIGLRRVMLQDYTFRGDIFVPKGSYICVPSYHIMNQQEGFAEARPFDGLRSYQLKVRENAMESTKHELTTTDETALGFGHGRTACPGRWLAALALKVVFTKIVSEYDFKFEDHAMGRPKSIFAHEIVYPDKSIKVWVRRRQESVRAPLSGGTTQV